MKTGTIELKNRFAFLGKDGKNPTLTYYLPYNMTEMNRQDQKRPCMLICPGGGYAMCSQRESEAVAVHYLPLGFNVFVLNYSVAPHRFPSQLLEVAAAYEFIKENAAEWNCDTEKMGIMGFSAGGHLAAHYSNAWDIPEVREVFSESYRPFASVLCYPVITAQPDIRHTGSFVNLLGHEPNADEIGKFSCEKLVRDDTPTAFLWHTAADNGVPAQSTLLYAQALSAHKIPYEVHIYPYGGHGMSTADEQTLDNVSSSEIYAQSWLGSLKSWLKLTFKI